MVETKNNADNTIYTAEKLLRENGDKVPAELKKEVEDGVAAVRTALNSDAVETIRSATEALNQQIQKVGASMYAQPDAAAPTGEAGTDPGSSEGPADPNGPKPDGDSDDVVDGEFKSV